MKLQKMLSRKYKGKKYYKYLVIIPEREIKKNMLKEGDELYVESDKGGLKIKKKKSNKTKSAFWPK